MSRNDTRTFSEKIGKLVGWGCGVIVASIIHTWIGLWALTNLGWLPFQ